MSKFKTKKGKGTPAINTSSLPDIIFMLLFFFMVTTTMREVTVRVQQKMPEATEVQKLDKKSLVSFIYIGEPSVDDIPEFVTKEREARDEADRKFITTSLKVDGNTKMGIVTDVKQELRKSGAFKINYSTRKKTQRNR